MRSGLRKSTWSLAAHTFAHFCVDFACFYQLFAGLARTSARLETVAIGFMAYNAVAFGLQPIIGFWCDRRRTVPAAIIGCLVVLAGLLLLPLGGLIMLPLVWPALLASALGNAFFHVGGGSESLLNAKGRMARSGVFVSSGALGVVLGTLSGKSAAPAFALPFILLILSAAALFYANPRPCCPLPLGGQDAQPHHVHDIRFQVSSSRYAFATVMLLCLVSITIRSYVGAMIPIAWRTTTALILLPAIGAMSGKAVGGLLADWLGARRVAVTSLLASLPLLVFGNGTPVACVLGIILFNISMAITLCAVYSMLPGYPGLSFGLTTLALLVGNLPTFFLAIPQSVNPYVLGILILASAGCLHLAVANQPQRMRTDLNGGTSDEKAMQSQIPDAL